MVARKGVSSFIVTWRDGGRQLREYLSSDLAPRVLITRPETLLNALLCAGL